MPRVSRGPVGAAGWDPTRDQDRPRRGDERRPGWPIEL